MSFSGEVKQELTQHMGSARHCMLAELAALLSCCGKYTLEPARLEIRAESERSFKKVFTLLQKTFNIRVSTADEGFTGVIDNPAHVCTVLYSVGLLERKEDGLHRRDHVDEKRILGRACCRKAYIRGAFLGSGSMTDPSKTYHMEFVSDTRVKAELLGELLRSFGVESHIIMRSRSSRSVYVLYLKDGSQIVDVLNIMGAHVALMELENVRIVKEMRNQINRQVNCEAANLDRVVSAAVKQTEDIRYIMDTVGLQGLPKSLSEMARVRLEHEDLSLKELGMLLDPPVGKSGVNHRLRKLSAIADELREVSSEKSRMEEK